MRYVTYANTGTVQIRGLQRTELSMLTYPTRYLVVIARMRLEESKTITIRRKTFKENHQFSQHFIKLRQWYTYKFTYEHHGVRTL